MTRRLHIVNGDIFAETLNASSIDGEVLAWRESLIDGPIVADVYSESNLMRRAAYFSRILGVSKHEFLKGSRAQLRTIAQWQNYDEIVLWFEYDLYDQAMLMSLLHWFHDQEKGLAWHQSTICLMELADFPGMDDFRGFGQLTAEQVSSLDGQWRPLLKEEIEAGARAWEAFASNDPRVLAELVFTSAPSSFPLLRDALEYHLLRFPDLGSGLSALEWDAMMDLRRFGVGIDGRKDSFTQSIDPMGSLIE